MRLKRLIILVLLFVCIPLPGHNPRGRGWKSETVADGITYHVFSGVDKVSGAPQQIFIIEQDLTHPDYALRFSYSPAKETASEVFRRTDAVAVMNATYEASSVVIKVNGDLHSCMPSEFVFTSPVPNWKSEGAVYTDGAQDVSISFDGKGKDISQQRSFYASSTMPNIFTSAPMLIDNFDPVGASFVNPALKPEVLAALHYENPLRHQGVRHPRSAIAKTADNHLLLIAVDGRRPGVSEGMSARELTLFLVKWFNPQYALNMDGGGSTTLCVKGFGDAESHVVNYPTDNKTYDHKGERRCDSHFYIVYDNKR